MALTKYTKLEVAMSLTLISIFIGSGAWGIACGSGKPPVRCEGQISAIDAKGNQTTEWFPKGCYHK